MIEARKFWVWIAVTFLLGIGAGAGSLALAKGVQPAPIVIESAPATATPAATATPGPIQVYVNGQVAVPAVYMLPPESLVAAAIEAAGGMTDEANGDVVNMAQTLQDGMQIYVPGLAEAATIEVFTAAAGEADGGGETAVTNSSGLVNINTATAAELDSLPGIGPSTAQNIIEHRQNNGDFATVEAIMEVTGIGGAKFASIEELITVTP